MFILGNEIRTIEEMTSIMNVTGPVLDYVFKKRKKKTIPLTLKEAQSQVWEENFYVNKYINYHKDLY